MNLLQHIKNVLSANEAFCKDGKLFKNKVIEAGLKLDTELLKLLLKDYKAKKHFFTEVDGIAVFDKAKFQKFISNKQFLPDSFTAFKNKIGLTANGEYLTEAKEVVLDFPYKDCVLEGGQTKEDQKRQEIFWNETLAPDEIDRLFEPKVLTNWKRYDKDGEHEVKSISLEDNLIIKGNNLIALHSLKKVYKGKVKLIYIDPPYNTGNDSFQYNDRFNHSTWLTFMKNRLEVAKELLTTDGTIAISIDHNEVGYLLTLLDSIFGKENRKNIISIKRSSVSGAKVINPGVVNVSEFLLLYSKSSSNWKPNKVFKAKKRDDRYNTFIINFEEEPENWKYESVLEALAKFKGVQKSKLKKELGVSYEVELENFFMDNRERIIRFAGLDDKSISDGVKKVKYISKDDDSKTYLFERENHKDYYLYKGNAILFFNDRLIQIDGKWEFGEMISDLWNDVLPNDIHNEGGVTLRKGKKPEKLLSRLIELATNENDIVLDYHLGSGTTAAVALKSGRKFIGIEQLDYGENDSLKRLSNVISGEQSGVSKAFNWEGGGSFVYAELAIQNAMLIDKINTAKETEYLLSQISDMKPYDFIKFNLDMALSEEEVADFKQLEFELQKQILIELIDKNQFYIGINDINDIDLKIDQTTKLLNHKFYS